MRGPPPWTHVDVSFDGALYDVTRHEDRVFAVGDNGRFIERADGHWTTHLADGPTGNANALRGVDTTTDGGRVWVGGASGVLGFLDHETGRIVDHSAPRGQTDQWNDLLVTGAAGSEVVHVGDGDGEVLTLRLDGSAVASTGLHKPASAGQPISSLVSDDQRRVYAGNADGTLFATPDGTDWTAHDIAADDLVDAAWHDGRVYTVTADGAGYAYDPADETISVFDTGLDTVAAIDAGDRVTAVGPDGVVADRLAGEWQPPSTPVDVNINGVVTGPPDLAVGASGTIIERESN